MAGFALGVEDELGVMTQVAAPGWAEAPDPRPRAAGGRRPVKRDDERLADILEAVIDGPQLASQVLAIQSGRADD